MDDMKPKSYIGRYLAEFLGTFLLVFLIDSCVAASQLTGATYGQWAISIICGLSVALAVYLTADISGAHLNPAVTIAFTLFGKAKKRDLIPYIIFQLFGGFCAASLVFGMFHDALIDFEATSQITRGTNDSLALAGIFSTFPQQSLSFYSAFMVEAVITCILMIMILSLTDDNATIPRGALSPLLIGLTIAVIGGTLGPLTGFAMNPARDFGPRVFSYLAGWGNIVFTGGREIPYFIVPIFAPIIGACVGAIIYNVLIGSQLTKK